MRIRDLLTAAGAFALTVAPALAQTADRATAPAEGTSQLAGQSSFLIIALIVALGIGIYFITKNDNNPSSP